MEGFVEGSGIFYYNCLGSEVQKEKVFQRKNRETRYYQSNSCKEGEWKYYKPDGTIWKPEYYEHGQKIQEGYKSVQ